MDCLFCKIINGEIPSTKVYEDKYVYAFRDIEPQMPQHVVIVPKTHISSANDITADNSSYIAKIYEAAAVIAKQLDVDKSGYRIINNCGADAGQTVFHIHFHLLGGRKIEKLVD